MKNKFIWILRILSAGILLQTLFFKFTAAPESVYIFQTLQVEPWGRWFAGFSELAAGILLLVPGLELLGAMAAIGIMVGAILSHFLFLGIVVQDDGGFLFALACIVLISCLLILVMRRQDVKNLARKVIKFKER